MLQTFVHYSLHFLVPLGIAFFFFRSNWHRVYLLLLATMLIDLDHLLASPIFDPNRCSIKFHLFHQYWAIAVYVLLFYFKKTRVIGLGLLLHMATDFIDCLWMR